MFFFFGGGGGGILVLDFCAEMETEIGLKWGFSNLTKKTNEWYFSKDHIFFIRSKGEHFQNYENVFYFFLKVLLVFEIFRFQNLYNLELHNVSKCNITKYV